MEQPSSRASAKSTTSTNLSPHWSHHSQSNSLAKNIDAAPPQTEVSGKGKLEYLEKNPNEYQHKTK